MDQFPPALADLENTPFSMKGAITDDSSQLVAYRLSFVGKATYNWAICFRGDHLANISKRDSRWVHDNWQYNYLEGGMGSVTRQNRPYFDRCLDDLMMAIRVAVTQRRADVVTLPVDSTKI